uniref:Farnesoic acid O-methyl transferase domain-containing protein n=1 Tax=Megaselia scalaris TaxID=36166 RepID=T1GDA2_MEGSC
MFSIVFLVAFLTFSSAGRLDDCKDSRTFVVLNARNLQNNSPRETELLRTKVHFKLSDPLFSVKDAENEIIFGQHNSSSSFAIYTSIKDYASNNNACNVVTSISKFSGSKFVEVDFILEKNGGFSVIIDDENFLYCETGFTFDFSKNHKIFISTSLLFDNEIFLYDCPFVNKI